MARKKQYVKKSFESTGKSSDVSANLYLSMLISPAWLALTTRQRQLYLYMKLQYYAVADKHHPNGDKSQFCFNWGLARNYKLYTNQKSFRDDIAALIEKGFIKCIQSGYNTKEKSIYQYSDKWQIWGNSNYKIDFNEMNLTGQHKQLSPKIKK